MLVFINYRSTDVPFAAGMIDQVLTNRFGRDQVFLDSRSIRPGSYFPPEIWRALGSCKVLFVVIGPRWFDRALDGQRLIDRPDDYVRREIALALTWGLAVLPVLVEDVRRLDVCELPADIAKLAGQQYRRLRMRDAEYDLQRLVNDVTDLVGGGIRHDDWTTRGGGSGPPAVSNYLSGPVDARGAVFGNYIERS